MSSRSVFILMLAVVSMAVAQPNPDTLWTRTYGGWDTDGASSIQQTTDGGFVVAGQTASFGAGGVDFYMVKTNSQGDTLWTRTYGGEGTDGSSSMQQTADGGYVVTGLTYSFGAGGYDLYMVKTDGQGNLQWTRAYGGSDNDQGNSIQQTTDGGYVVAGQTASFGAGGNDFYVVKTDGQGNPLWTRTFGGTNTDWANSIQQTADGGYIVAGFSNSFGAGGYDVYVVKTNSQGDTLWTRTYGGDNDDYATSIQRTTDGGYVIAGYTTSFGASSYDFFVVKINAHGDTLWTRSYGGGADDYATSIQQTRCGGYVVAGYTNSFGAGQGDFYVVKINAQGDTLWTRTYGGDNDDYANSIQQTTDDGYVVAGWTSSFGSGGYDLYVVKTGPDVPSPAIPEHLVIQSVPSGVRLAWNSANEDGILYRVYSDSLLGGEFATRLATTSDTTFVDVNALNDPLLTKFYRVKAVKTCSVNP